MPNEVCAVQCEDNFFTFSRTDSEDTGVRSNLFSESLRNTHYRWSGILSAGDVVILHDDLDENDDECVGIAEEMEGFAGTSVTIHRVNGDTFNIEEDDRQHTWGVGLIERVRTVKEFSVEDAYKKLNKEETFQ